MLNQPGLLTYIKLLDIYSNCAIIYYVDYGKDQSQVAGLQPSSSKLELLSATVD